jgi:EAL domain-containing protein (putative c-di-GMP-specific phosphodiesterase class I)
MPPTDKSIRQSISIPNQIAKQVKTIAKRQRVSANRVLVELIEAGLESKEAEKRKFFELAEQLQTSGNGSEQRRLKEELARMTFGE